MGRRGRRLIRTRCMSDGIISSRRSGICCGGWGRRCRRAAFACVDREVYTTLPGFSQDVAAVEEMASIGREYFQRDGAVVTAVMERLNAALHIHRARSERQMQIGVAAAIIVQMDVPQPPAVGREDLLSGVLRDLQIRMPD